VKISVDRTGTRQEDPLPDEQLSAALGRLCNIDYVRQCMKLQKHLTTHTHTRTHTHTHTHAELSPFIISEQVIEAVTVSTHLTLYPEFLSGFPQSFLARNKILVSMLYRYRLIPYP
jgi:predicted ABC-type transport system involved in lysophospholipase L1 biosynthesis ATPase subunit